MTCDARDLLKACVVQRAVIDVGAALIEMSRAKATLRPPLVAFAAECACAEPATCGARRALELFDRLVAFGGQIEAYVQGPSTDAWPLAKGVQ